MSPRKIGEPDFTPRTDAQLDAAMQACGCVGCRLDFRPEVAEYAIGVVIGVVVEQLARGAWRAHVEDMVRTEACPWGVFRLGMIHGAQAHAEIGLSQAGLKQAAVRLRDQYPDGLPPGVEPTMADLNLHMVTSKVKLAPDGVTPERIEIQPEQENPDLPPMLRKLLATLGPIDLQQGEPFRSAAARIIREQRGKAGKADSAPIGPLGPPVEPPAGWAPME